MAHYAQIDDNNIVLQVVVIDTNETTDDNNVERETLGIARCKEIFGEDTNWVQTSYNANIRYNFAGVGFTYDSTRDAFIEPQPYPSWLLDENECTWYPPTPYPDTELDENGQPIDDYEWNEDTTNWDLILD